MQVLHEISTPQLVRDFQKSTTRERHVENNFRTELWTPSGCVRWEPHKARPSSRIAYLSCRSGDSEPRPYRDRSLQDKWLTAGVKNLARMKQPGSKKTFISLAPRLSNDTAHHHRIGGQEFQQPAGVSGWWKMPQILWSTPKEMLRRNCSLDIATKTASARLYRSSGRVSPRQQACKPSLRNDVMHQKWWDGKVYPNLVGSWWTVDPSHVHHTLVPILMLSFKMTTSSLSGSLPQSGQELDSRASAL